MRFRTVLNTISFLCVGLAAGWLHPVDSFSGEGAGETIELQTGLYYTIRKGDTLWDITEHFYDSPWLWPDLWQKNSRITNPHWIEPGERIRLFSREELETLVEPMPEPGPEPEEVVEPQPQESPYYFYPSINSVGFIREKPVSPSGAIFKVKGDKVMISEGDLVYIRPVEKAAFTPGERFTVFRTLKPLKDRKTRARIGIQHDMLGVVEITEVNPEFCMGRVVQSFRYIALNDLLMPYKKRSPKITLTESKKGLEGKIIAAEGRETIFGDNTVVFIDKGGKDGVRAGQSYNIYYQEKERINPKAKQEVLLSPVDYGDILILHTEKTTATALVTRAEKTVQPGARIHTASP